MNKYIEYICCIKTAKIAGVKEPHKPILLLSVIDLIEKGLIMDNRIELSEALERQFAHNWKRCVGDSILFQAKIATPFWHLQNEPFWRLRSDSRGVIDVSKSKPIYAVSSIRSQGVYAEIDSELFELLKSEENRARVRVLLISTYLNNNQLQKNDILPIMIGIGSSLIAIAS